MAYAEAVVGAVVIEVVVVVKVGSRWQTRCWAVAVVDAIGGTEFNGVRVDVDVAVVAVVWGQRGVFAFGSAAAEAVQWVAVIIAIAVSVPILAEQGVDVVGAAVTVFVGVVGAGFDAVGADFRQNVVAVLVVVHIAGGCRAADKGHGGVAIAIAIGVKEPHGGINRIVFVNDGVAVVVDAVAALFGTWVGGVGAVVAICVVENKATGAGVEAGVLRRDVGIAKAVLVVVDKPGFLNPVVDEAVAVLVDSVTDLCGVRANIAGGIVTVVGVGAVASRLLTLFEGSGTGVAAAVAIAVGIDKPNFVGDHSPVGIVDQAVAIVVDLVADLSFAG